VTSPVAVSGLSVEFGGVRALDDVGFQVEEGEAMAIVGPNGAGKSTLLNAINGVVRPAAGSVRLLGRQVDGWRAHQVARHGVHRTFQHPHVLESESVLRNVMIGGHVDREWLWSPQVLRPFATARREEELRRECLDLLETADLGGAAHMKTADLPYGMKKLVDILRSLVGSPTVLLLDEPSSGMGEVDRQTLINLLLKVRAEFGTTLLIVEHHMDVVRAVADRVIALAQGTLMVDAQVAEVSDLTNLGLASAAHDPDISIPAADSAMAESLTSKEKP
jgi:branched-chain amino acid transport system ATP-binding protein